MLDFGERHTGWVRNFRGQWGFINSDSFEGDLFVGLKQNPHLTSLSTDDKVEFEVRKSETGKAEAVHVVVIQPSTNLGLGAGVDGTIPVAGQRLSGWVRSFRDTWGFINSDSFSGDLFVGLKSNRGMEALTAEDEVTFEIKADAGGKAEAVNVQLRNKPPSPTVLQTGPAVRAQAGHLVGQNLSGRIKNFRDNWGFINSDHFVGDLFVHQRSNPLLRTAAPGDPVEFEVAEDTNATGQFMAVNTVLVKQDPKEMVGERIRGWVKSFKNTWGFLNSSRFEGDIFVGLKNNSHLEKEPLQSGEPVEFQIGRDEKAANGLHAVKVKRVKDPTFKLPPNLATATAVNSSQPPVVSGLASIGRGVKPEQLVGSRAVGTVRSFKDGWGFITSTHFEGDLFLHQGSNSHLTSLSQGDSVVFDIQLSGSGKCHATKVQVVPDLDHRGVIGRIPSRRAEATPPVQLSLDQMVGRRTTGSVRSFRGQWGFVTSPKFVGDLFVGLKTNPHIASLSQGDEIDFIVQRSNTKGSVSGFEAVEVKILKLAIHTQNGSMDEPPNDRSRSPFGHAATRSQTASRSQNVVSTVGVIGSSVPPPSRAKTLPSTNTASASKNKGPAAFVGQVLEGWVRSFRDTWGFINSDDFEGDLFMGNKSNPGLHHDFLPNDRVRFKVTAGPSGKLEATCVEVL